MSDNETFGNEENIDTNGYNKDENGNGTDAHDDKNNGDLQQQISNTGSLDGAEPMNDDNDLDSVTQRVKGMDEEAARLIQLQSEMEQQMKSTSSPTSNFGGSFSSQPMSAEDRMDADLRSIYVGNVDYSATAQELEAHFHGCGSINRVTILCDKFSGHPKGFAYVEFGDKDAVQTAQALDDSLFKGRQIKVVSKRTNRPGISSTDRYPRGGGRGGGAAGFAGGFGAGGYMGRGRGGFRGGPRGGFGASPYMRPIGGRAMRGGRGGYNNFYSPY